MAIVLLILFSGCDTFDKNYIVFKQEDEILKAFYYTEEGEKIPQVGFVQMAIVDEIPDIQYVSLQVNIKNTGEVPLRDFTITGTPSQFNDALSDFQLTELSIEDSSTYETLLIDIDTLPSGDVKFSVDIIADSDVGIVTKSASLTINIQKPICSDGTQLNECSSTKPYYCENAELIQKASICGCETTYQVSGNQCILPYECVVNEDCVQSSSGSCVPKTVKTVNV